MKSEAFNNGTQTNNCIAIGFIPNSIVIPAKIIQLLGVVLYKLFLERYYLRYKKEGGVFYEF